MPKPIKKMVRVCCTCPAVISKLVATVGKAGKYISIAAATRALREARRIISCKLSGFLVSVITRSLESFSVAMRS
jgi:hypothetical protein